MIVLIKSFSDLDAASLGWDLLFQYHGRPSGIYAADEYLAGLEAARGYVYLHSFSEAISHAYCRARTELCLVVVSFFDALDPCHGARP